MPNHYHHNFKELDTYLHDTGALYLSDLLDEMLYVLMCYSPKLAQVCDLCLQMIKRVCDPV
ncbi:hypothetical protein C900_00510 [Fulvivirga imtechensis AK7]|uniref:Uncharacterized protein n=1 Tax=Fulvivirga imtechensis AK7 TaxID=1237149 RepID=L8JXV4_9BACT|nr:hypothetical protein [Fulvivirga imtechensis]ELR73008.1 hypothetical protein C900_00510 [Fulvivirga imtechensis AK7]